jgi:hypothetical protein
MPAAFTGGFYGSQWPSVEKMPVSVGVGLDLLPEPGYWYTGASD